MGLARYYLPELTKGNYTFSSEEARHISGAKRQKVGDFFEVFDGRGNFVKVKIIELKSRKINIEVIADIEHVKKNLPRIEMAVAIPKGKRQQYMIEKLVETGVDKIVPIVYDRSVAGGDDPVEKYTRWAIEACKQSKNCWIPEFFPAVKFAEYINGITSNIIMADYTGESILTLVGEKDFKFDKCICLVGPEGGFSPEEFELAEKAGVRKINLSPNVLRIETAAVAFASTIMAVRNR